MGSITSILTNVNSTVCKSDIGNKILEQYPNVDFVVIYQYDEIKCITLFSLVSHNVDVGAIAFKFGGGGHKLGAGIQVQGLVHRLPECKN